jgi:hypothetical protein
VNWFATRETVMCHGLMVCHGDKVIELNGVYSDEQASRIPKDSKPAMFYITSDGKYAIDADFVSLEDIGNFDINVVPKIELKPK